MRSLLQKVFAPAPTGTRLLVLVDVPDNTVPDSPDWQDRRRIAAEWFELLGRIGPRLALARVEMLYYQNAGSNNANFPKLVYQWRGAAEKASLAALQAEGISADLEATLKNTDIILVPAHFSATAPLKLRAEEYGFKAASMPGFNRAMMPALKLDFDKVHEQVMRIKQRLDEADAIEMHFIAQHGRPLSLFVDVNGMCGTASSGLLRERGSAGNLPSGEAFVVPYEGTLDKPSRTSGKLPVQFGDDVIIYDIERNRAIRVSGESEYSGIERTKLRGEPAYGNIAEIGFGVLRRFDIHPVGEILLDEKLGLHVAFGRSDHFGGAVGPKDFRDARKIVHIDRVYIPEIQDKVLVREVIFVYSDGRREVIINNSEYVV